VSTAEEPDSLIRAVAASPLREPPAGRTSVIAVGPLDRPGELETVRQRVNRFGGRLEVRADGILLVTLPQGEAVARAASLALALAEAHPTARIGLGTARTEMVAVDSATALLKQ